MDNPFGSPTVRPDNPINDALKAEPFSPSSSFSRTPASPPPGSSRPSLPNPTRSYDRSGPRPNSRISQQSRQQSTTSPSTTKTNSTHSPSFLAKTPRNPTKRYSSDYSRRGGASADTQSVLSSVSKGPRAQDFQEPTPEQLVRFSALCRRQYYDNDAESARKVGEILAKLPPSSVAIYSRTMATVRSEYHRDKEIERRIKVETILATILPGSSIKQALGVSLEDGMGGGVAAMRSSKARRARYEAFKAFVDSNCVKQIPGCHPFFRSLFGALWLQSIEPGRGGAGNRRVEWEIDVAVFTEAGGGDSWTRDAVEALKGILGMDERVKEPSHTDTYRSSIRSESISLADDNTPVNPAIISSAAEVTEEHVMLGDKEESPTTKRKEPPAVPPHRNSLRHRSPSDPFCDPHDKANSEPPALPPRSSPRLELPSPDLSSTTVSTPFLLASDLPSPDPISPVSPVSPSLASPELEQKTPLLPAASSIPPPRIASVEPQFRIFTLPAYLTNPELRSLCRVFPEFIASPARTGSRFRSASVGSMDQTKAQKDAGVNTRAERGGGGKGPAKIGHGELRIGAGERDAGWRGTWWERFVAWFKALFSMG
ncbi:uncharacterized protein JCM6883_000968 [Sporobolomyces salmoneus]|uniref:uncharacterized protein n=1 Tax=Sporobolomyces salmoneus TaxID=183962 RepID=UPI00316B2E11